MKLIWNFGPAGAYLGYNPELHHLSLGHTSHCFERLLRVTDAGKAEPWLVTDWEIDPSKLTAKLTLRQGVKFHDGTDFNAEAAVWNMRRVMGTSSPYFASWDSAEVLDDYTVLLKLKSYTNMLTTALARVVMISPTAVETHGEKWANQNPVGTGPFKFVSFTKDKSLKFIRNDKYWQDGRPYLDGVEYIYIVDKMTRQLAFMAGKGHIAYNLKGTQRLELEAKGFEYAPPPAYGGSITVIDFDSRHKDSPFSDIRVREAVSLALDRKAICAARGFGVWEPIGQFAPPGSIAHIPDLPRGRYDPERAKQLLAEAGYTDGFKAKLIPCTTSVDRDEVVLVHGYLKKVGIDVDIDFVDAAAFRKIRYQTGWNNGMLINGMVGHPNFANVMNTFCSQNSITSHTSWVSEEFAEALDDALGTLEMEPKRMQKVNRLAVEGLFQVPVHTQPGGPQPVMQANVHDHGLLKQQEHLFMSSESCWLSK